jgi:hypothetical protein
MPRGVINNDIEARDLKTFAIDNFANHIRFLKFGDTK